MKSKKRQVSLKKTIVLALICVMVGSASIISGHYFSNTAERNLNTSKNQFLTVSRRYVDFDQEKELLNAYHPQFVALRQSGIIGDERRLNWIEVLHESGERIKLPSLNYSIQSQEVYKQEFITSHGGYMTIYRSGMELNLGLLHEGDFFSLLNHLDHDAKGSYTVSKCTFSMPANEIVFKKDHVNILASCLLHWFTINTDNQEVNI